ncbi:5-formyltetrahydrofolate cyclo-ligase [Terrimicrobium sacchariphilum]|uniref:5-formyltetrahydrofolate cyclo-ligase n=1 Tax=Terrimicrobium sacchariphilum TaxID=690879 RepID=A0A146G7B4_TERSA|nr:5-formyltetrahydrofolate cyclo-ligase [Terrimicrobium sacchariphilum]GAT33401.1 5-formyltetrahydrofolate cyclo-ligase [Terrimicrobium sacchariphilum]
MIPNEKQILRTAARRALAAFPGKKWASGEISRRLAESAIWKNSRVIYAYHPLPSEPDWQPAAVAGEHIIAFPRIEGNRMEFLIPSEFTLGGLGIQEPSEGEIAPPPDLILVPGMAFDQSGGRLGRGKGHYDRWLMGHPKVPRLGLCFECQIVDAIPLEDHDLKVDSVVTEQRGP